MLRRSRGVLRSFGHTLSKLINRASLYRFTDDALLLSSSAAGIIVGLVIVVYHLVLQLFESGLHVLTPARWEMGTAISWSALMLPLIAAAGGVLVGVLKQTVFKDVSHRGLNSVADSLKGGASSLTWRHALHAIILSSVSIATGGGAGREAPTVVLGSSVASGMGRLGRMDRGHVKVLGAAGAAAAISGIFNAPLGGILFAVEAITGELRARTFLPIVISSVLATTTVRTLLGNTPLIIEPTVSPLGLLDYPLLAAAGICSAFVAAIHLRLYRKTFERTSDMLSRFSPITKAGIGGFIVGIPLILFPWLLETTYEPVNLAVSGSMHTSPLIGLGLAIAVIVLKPITNAVTLASGGEGGTFAPALKVGALFGFCFGVLLDLIVPTPIGLYALVCAGAVLAGTFRAPLTGGILLFEVSGNYSLLLPLLFSSVVAVYIIKRLNTPTFNPLDDEDVFGVTERKTDL